MIEHTEHSRRFIINASPEQLVEASENVAADIAFWSEQHGNAEAAKIIADHDFAAWKSKQRADALEAAARAGEKKPTESSMDDAYRTHDEYMVYVKRCAQAEADVTRLQGAYQAAKARASMIESLLGKAGITPEMLGKRPKLADQPIGQNVREIVEETTKKSPPPKRPPKRS